MRLCGGGKVFGGEKARQSFFSSPKHFSLSICHLAVLVVFVSPPTRSLSEPSTVTCVAHFCELEIEKLISWFSCFCSWKAELNVGWNSSHLQCLFFRCWFHENDNHLNSIKLGQRRRSESVLRMILWKDFASMKWANNLRKARITPQLKRSTGRRLGKKSATRKKTLAPISLELSTKAKGQISDSSS